MARWTPPRERQELLRGTIRERVIAGIHSGQYDIGDRLPTYREIAAETGADLRAIARVYRELEEEGLVEVRGRSGVFVARQERIGGRVLAETARWVIGTLQEARLRRIRVPRFPEMVRRCIATTEVRSAVIASTEDQLAALSEELHTDFGFAAVPIHLDRIARDGGKTRAADRLPEEVTGAHFLVTTVYDAAAVRPLSERLEKPLVVVRLDAGLMRSLRERVSEGELTVVHVDPLLADRLRSQVGEHADRIRSVLASDRGAIARLDLSEPAIISPAARQVLGDVPLPPSVHQGPIICTESAGELIELLVRFNLEAMRET